MRGFFGSSKKYELEHAYDSDREKGADSDSDDISTISGGSKPPAYSKDPSLLIETPHEKRLRKRSHWVAYTTMFVMTVGFSVVLSGVWPYLQVLDKSLTKQSLGWVVAANPFGQMVASPIVGYMGNRLGSIRVVCYFTMAFFILGNMVYAFLPLMDDWWDHSAYHIMILARFVVGVSSSNVTLCRSYLAGSTTTKERTTGIAIISAAQSLGFVVGPAAQTILSLIIEEEALKYRTAGWFAALLGVINFVLLTPWVFKEYNIAEKERELLKAGNDDDSKFVLPKVDYVALFGVLFGFFMDQFIYVLLETLMEPFLADQYSWCNDIAVVVVGIAFACAGILAVAMFITATRLAKIYDERKILIFCAFVPISIGVFLFLPWGPEKLDYCPSEFLTTSIPVTTEMYESTLDSFKLSGDIHHPRNLYSLYDVGINPVLSNDNGKWCNTSLCYGCPVEQTWCKDYNRLPMSQFFIAFTIVILGYPFGVSMSNAIFSKILGPRPQGLWMGVLTAAGSLSRVLGPIFVSYLYTNQGTTWTFSVLFVGMLIAILELSLLYKRIVPMKIVPLKEKGKS